MSLQTDPVQAQHRQDFLQALARRLQLLRQAALRFDQAVADCSAAAELAAGASALAAEAGALDMPALGAAARELAQMAAAPAAERQRLWAQLDRLARLAEQCLISPALQLGPPPPLHAKQQPLTPPLVCLVGPTLAQDETLRDWLIEHDCEQLCLSDLEALGGACRQGRLPSVVIVDSPGSQANLRQLGQARLQCERLFPVIWIGDWPDLASRLAAHRSGVNHVLPRSFEQAQLLRLLAELTEDPKNPRLRALLVSDKPLPLAPLMAALAEQGLDLRELQSAEPLLATLRGYQPDVLLIDARLGAPDARELASMLHGDTSIRDSLTISLLVDAPPAMAALPAEVDALSLSAEPRQTAELVKAQALRARRQVLLSRHLLHTSYERQREHLALNQHALVSIANARGRITYANELFCATSGYSRAELLGRKHSILKSGVHGAAFYRDMWQTIASGHVWQGEVCNRRKDGRLYWVASTITPLLGPDGKPYQYISIRTEITGVKQAEAALREQNEQRQVITRVAASLLAMEGDDAGPMIDAALQASGALLGADRARLLLYADDGVTVVHTHQWPASGRAPSACEQLAVALQGESGALGQLVFESAHDAGAWGSGHADFARVLAELLATALSRQRARQQLSASLGLLDRMGELADVGGWEIDARTGSLSWTSHTFRLHELPPGKPPTLSQWLSYFPAPARAELEGAIRLALQQAKPFDLELPLLTAAARPRWVRCKGEAQQHDGQLLRVTGVFQDISLRREADEARRLTEIELATALDTAEQASRAKSEFLAHMSHELRTPMNAVLGFGQLLELDAGLNAKQQGYVRELLKGGRHLLALISDVLDLVRVEAGRLELMPESVDLAPLIAECLALAEPLAAQRGIRLEQRDVQGRAVHADRLRLRQVLMNLLSNAIKYNRENGTVLVSASQPAPGRLRLTVRDSGVGIAADKLAELFQPFSRLGMENGSVEGTGIGLVITKRLIELMDGSVGVASQPGAGSEFWVELPRDDSPPQRIADDPASAASRTVPDLPQRTLLYIEDNPANLELVAHVIRRVPGLNLITAQAPQLGLELARVHNPDLILLDIQMPFMDGYQVLAALRASACCAKVPVVALTAYAMPSELARGLAAGFDAYLTKPLDIARFLEVLHELLEGAQGSRA